MNKTAFLLLTTFTTFLLSSCNDDIVKSAATPAPTVVGIWKTTGLGAVTDAKTVDATLDDIKKTNEKASTALALNTFEFKADGTAISPGSSSSGSATDAGKYTLSADKKIITITSNTTKDSKGNPNVQTFEIVSLTDTELRLGITSTLSKKDAKGAFVVDLLSNDFATYLFGVYVFASKGLDPEKELIAAKTLQITYNLKK